MSQPEVFTPFAQASAIWLVACVHIFLSPYTKVEESFATQAIHDFLFLSEPRSLPENFLSFFRKNFNQNTSQERRPENVYWDHESFPGVVSRTFFSSFLIYLFMCPIVALTAFEDKFYYQILSRISLVTLFSFAYYRFCVAVKKSFGTTVCKWMTCLILSQFHLIFYASRPLPNTVALIFVLVVFSAWVEQKWPLLISLVAFTVLVIRFETIILFGCIILCEVFYTRRLSLITVLKLGIPSGLIFLTFTIVFDSYMWNRLIWPEGDGILFNVWHNQSHRWGTQPFMWYFYSVLPRLLLSTTIFAFISTFWSDFQTRKYATVAFIFVFLYSFLPHKELRFVIYVVPLLNLCASKVIVDLLREFKSSNDQYEPQYNFSGDELNVRTRSNLRRRPISHFALHESSSKHSEPKHPSGHNLLSRWRQKIVSVALCRILIVCSLLLNLAISIFMLFISARNYPGGECMRTVNNMITNDKSALNRSISTYVSNLAAQSGFTRFMQLDDVYYNKDPQFVLDRFRSFDVIYLALEMDNDNSYLEECPTSTHWCLRETTNGQESEQYRYECGQLQNITAFERIDIRQMRLQFKPFLTILRCEKRFQLPLSSNTK